jgi:Rad3-related DNA helicase
VIPRVPFGAPVVVDGEAVTSYLDAKVTAVLRLRQAIGRGLRTPDAVCTILIYDARAAKLGTFVPYRFEAQWAQRKVFEEGAREEPGVRG